VINEMAGQHQYQIIKSNQKYNLSWHHGIRAYQWRAGSGELNEAKYQASYYDIANV